MASSEVWDAATGQNVAGPTLSVARKGLTSTTLIDGTVLLAGGNDGTQDTASAEIFDPAAGTVAPAGAMSAARSGHLAVLLPHNNSVLLVGGSTAVAAVELYQSWTGSFVSTGSMSAARAQAAASATGSDGMLLVAGGSDGAANLNSGEVYGFATIKTDKDDYAPGEIVTITGGGWEADDSVMFTLTEVNNPNPHPPRVWFLTADAAGNVFDNSFYPEEHDLGIRFMLTAVGASSQAQGTFTDGSVRVDAVSNSPFSPNQASSPGVKDTTVITVKHTGSGSECNVRVRIKAGSIAGGSFARELNVSGTLSSGTSSATVTWDGKDSSSVFVADGTYTAWAAWGTPGSGGSCSGTSETTSPASNLGTIVVDNANPTVTLDSPADNAFVKSPPSISLEASPVDASNIDKVEFYVDGGFVDDDDNSGGGWNVNFDTSSLSDGDHTWYAKAFDKAGNNASSTSRTIKVDNSDPSVAINPIADGPVGSTFIITGTSSDLPVAAGYGVASVDVSISGPGPVSGPATNTGTNFSTWSFSYTPTAAQAGSHTVTAKATDTAGNFTNASPVSFTVVSDSTPPVITPNVVGTLGSNGWYTSDVTVSFTVTDPDSTVTSRSAPCLTDLTTTTINTDTAGQNVVCTATSAGGTATNTVTIKRDASGPSANLAVTAGTLGANGWYTSDVTVSTSGTDSISSPVTCSADQDISTEGAAVAVNGSCTNDAGLSTNASQLDLKIDKTGPSANLAVTAGTPGTNGWYTSDVTVDTDGSDSVSGIESCTADQFQTSETSGTLFNGSCTNNAGLTTNATALNVKLDKTAPTGVLLTPSGTLGANGWYTSDVTVATSGTDSISGPVVCTADQVLSTETTGQVVNANCTNDAGLKTDAAPLTIKLDKTGPIANLAVTAGTPGANGWYISDVTVGTSGSDSISSPVTCSVDQFQTAETTGTVFNGDCTNDAGLKTDAAPLTVKLDKTAPTAVALSVTFGTLGNNGWYVSNVTIHTAGTEDISAPASCTADQYQTTDTTGTNFNGSCTNDAGLTATASALTIKRDATAPTINLVTPAAAGSYTLNGGYASNYTCDDPTSGLATCAGPVANGANFSTNPVGSHTFTVNATDNAGNSATPATHTYSVLYSTGACLGNFGHTILQPINVDFSSIFKQGSTTPAKFRVCDANGVSIGTLGVVSDFRLTGYTSAPAGPVNEPVDSTTPDLAFRWSPTDQQWIFNVSTKQSPFAKGLSYVFTITLNDGSAIVFGYTLK